MRGLAGKRGLAGRRVLITRPRVQADSLIAKLTSLGAIPIVFPTIEITPLAEHDLLDQAISELGTYRWVIFTSVNGVSSFWERLRFLGKGPEAFNGVLVAAIGPVTAQALREQGIQPDFVPEETIAEAILPGLGDVRGQRILLPRVEIARKALADELEKQGAILQEISVYRTLPAQPDAEMLKELEAGLDFATFTSSSTVRNFVELLGDQAGERLQRAVVACIGPITAETARACGLKVDLVAVEYTVDGLVNALLNYAKEDEK